MNELTIDPEFRRLCRDLTPEERNLLEASIDSEGCRDAIVVWANHQSTILDGYNRYEICTQLGKPFKTKAIALPDRVACIEWIIANQLGKRNLTEAEKSFLRGKRYRAEKKAVGRPANSETVSDLDTASRLAAQYSVSDRTIRNDADFAESVDTIAANVGQDARSEILGERAGLTRDEIQAIADAPPESQAEAYQAAKCHVSNNSGNQEWYTPPDIVERARAVLGKIDLDPASCEVAQTNVKAKRFFSAEQDGLAQKWRGKVWMNPPYSNGTCAKFVAKLLEHYAAGDVPQACVLVNNATETAWLQSLLTVCCAVCFPAGRVQFLDRTGQPAKSPLQGQAIVYLGPSVENFRIEFSELGPVFERMVS